MADGTSDVQRPQRSCAIELRAIREDSREVDFVCSTETKDTYGTVIKQDWDLKRFKKNPVVLWAHCSRELPVGQAIRIEVKDGQLEATIRIASAAANPLAENVWQSIREKTLRGISVGFDPHTYHWEMEDDDEYLVLSDNELLELSICPLPSNPEALARQRAMATERAKERDHVAASGSPYRRAGKLDESAGPPTEDPGPSHERGPQKETEMDPKEKAALEARIAKLETKNRELDFSARTASTDLKVKTERVAALETEVKALTGQTERLVQERDAATERATKAEREVAGLEVRALVGTKISAAEVDEYIELRQTNKPLFERFISQRKDMQLTTPVIKADENDKPPPAVDQRTAAAASDDDDWAAVEKAASSAN